MTRPARIYTRGGDDGTTGLFGGRRLPKNSVRIDCIGAVDECSSAIGLARRALADAGAQGRPLERWLSWTQDMLFNLGAQLASPDGKQPEGMPRIAQSDVASLEASIDTVVELLPPLTQFIHPGGAAGGAHLHFARAVCRRAERRLSELNEREPLPPVAMQFVNRLSDALFVWARYANQIAGEPEHVWNSAAAAPHGIDDKA
jgi:cob(I)alamin adenosyltransferase